MIKISRIYMPFFMLTISGFVNSATVNDTMSACAPLQDELFYCKTKDHTQISLCQAQNSDSPLIYLKIKSIKYNTAEVYDYSKDFKEFYFNRLEQNYISNFGTTPEAITLGVTANNFFEIHWEDSVAAWDSPTHRKVLPLGEVEYKDTLFKCLSPTIRQQLINYNFKTRYTGD